MATALTSVVQEGARKAFCAQGHMVTGLSLVGIKHFLGWTNEKETLRDVKLPTTEENMYRSIKEA